MKLSVAYKLANAADEVTFDALINAVGRLMEERIKAEAAIDRIRVALKKRAQPK